MQFRQAVLEKTHSMKRGGCSNDAQQRLTVTLTLKVVAAELQLRQPRQRGSAARSHRGCDSLPRILTQATTSQIDGCHNVPIGIQNGDEGIRVCRV
jgi:hypothetical protein